MKKNLFLMITVLLASAILSCSGAAPSSSAAPTAPSPAETSATPSAETEAPVPEEPPVKAGMTVREIGTEAAWKVLQETALAFYYANPNTQYDHVTDNTVFGMEAGTRVTSRRAPETFTAEEPYYAVCRSLPPDIYWDAFHFLTPGIDGFGFHASVQINFVVYCYGEKYRKYAGSRTIYYPDAEKDAFMEELKAGLEPGDVILAGQSDVGSHVILYLGDCLGDGKDYVIHSWPYMGGYWNPAGGNEMPEPSGGTRLQEAKGVLFSGMANPSYPLTSQKVDQILVCRFTGNERFLKAELTEAGAVRYAKQGLDIRKTSDFDVYDTVLPGEEITITEKITNHSKEGYSLTVREHIAQGTSFVSASSTGDDPGKEQNGTIDWTVFVPAGGSAEVSYRVRVEETEVTELQFPSGLIDGGLPTREVRTKVGKSRITAEECQKLSAVGESTADSCGGPEFMDLSFVPAFYEKVLGVKLSFPETVQELLEGLYKVEKPFFSSREEGLLKKDGPDPELTDCLIPRCEIGRYLVLKEYRTNKDRALFLKEEYFLPGDVLVELREENKTSALKAEAIWISVYLGNGRVLQYSADGAKILKYANVFEIATRDHYAAVLRPFNGLVR